MKYTRKLLMIGAIVLVATFVSAAILPHFNYTKLEAEAIQGIMTDDQPYDQPIVDVIEEAIGGCCYCFQHHIDYNENGCVCQWLTFEMLPAPIGITVTIRELCNPCEECGEVREPVWCDCECPEMEMPFKICPGQTIYYCTCYYFDPLIKPGPYNFNVLKLIPAPAPEEL